LAGGHFTIAGFKGDPDTDSDSGDFCFLYIYIYTLKNIKLIFLKKIILIYFQVFLKNILHYTILY
jgi:hypothetical protein